MAKEDGGGGFSIPWPTIIALVTLAGGAYLVLPPLRSPRPVTTDATARPAKLGDQAIDARLWQDPFEAIQEQAAKVRPAEGSSAISVMGLPLSHVSADHTTAAFAADARPRMIQAHRHITPDSCLRQICQRVRFLIAMVEGGRYAESRESRLRTRSAVASGLGACGFVPVDSNRIGFFKMTWPRSVRYGEVASSDASSDLTVPFEWFEKVPSLNRFPKSDKIRQTEAIVVLWLKDDDFADAPLTRISQFVDRLGTELRGGILGRAVHWPVSVDVLGPWGSTTLRSLYTEAVLLDENYPARPALEAVTFYSAIATAEDGILTHDIPKYAKVDLASRIDDLLESRGVNLIRTTPDDNDLSAALLRELKLRGVDPAAKDRKESVAIISEWDTTYGRTLPFTFAARVAGAMHGGVVAREVEVDIGRWPDRVWRYAYMRGIDGMHPSYNKSANNNSPGVDAQKGGSSTPSLTTRIGQEPPDGTNQSDYLRRLADSIRQRADDAFRKGERLKAIGVLGSDLYDKLLILQALRPKFPDVIFFTTDVDARLAHPAHWGEAHNLIIASPYGLSLDLSYQVRVAPFRDTYQTATYAAVLRAFDAYSQDLAPKSPRVFEVGRTRLADLSPIPSHPTIYPDPRDARYLNPLLMSGRFLLGLSAASLLLLFAILVVPKRQRWSILRALSAPPAFAVLSVAVVCTVIALLWRLPGGMHEPFAFFEGVSIWPVVGLRAIALMMSGFFIWYGQRQLRENERELTRAFCLDRPDRRKQPPGFIKVRKLWLQHLRRSRRRERFGRSVIASLIYLMFGAALIFANGETFVPARGPVSAITDYLVGYACDCAIVLLCFLVIDASIVTRHFILQLTADTSMWPSPVCRDGAKMFGVSPKVTSAWLDVEMIAKRTHVVQKLIYLPFIVLTLRIVSQLNLFDSYGWPPQVLVFLGVTFTLAFGAAWLLRSSAERGKAVALETLQKLEWAEGRPEARRRLRNMTLDIESNRQGAFDAFSTNPALRALVLPGGGFALITLVEHLTRYMMTN